MRNANEWDDLTDQKKIEKLRDLLLKFGVKAEETRCEMLDFKEDARQAWKRQQILVERILKTFEDGATVTKDDIDITADMIAGIRNDMDSLRRTIRKL